MGVYSVDVVIVLHENGKINFVLLLFVVQLHICVLGMKRIVFVLLVCVLLVLYPIICTAEEMNSSKDDDKQRTTLVEGGATTTTTTKEPPATTKEPESTTKAPPATTKEPPANTKEPESTTKAPPATTKEPPANTKEPESTTQAPPATTKAPPATTKEPPANTKEPVKTTLPPPTIDIDQSEGEEDDDIRVTDKPSQPSHTKLSSSSSLEGDNTWIFMIGGIGFFAFAYFYFYKIRGTRRNNNQGPSFERIPLEEIRSGSNSPPPFKAEEDLEVDDGVAMVKRVMVDLGIPEFGAQKYALVFKNANLTRVSKIRKLDEMEWKILDVPEVIKTAVKKAASSRNDDRSYAKGFNPKNEISRRNTPPKPFGLEPNVGTHKKSFSLGVLPLEEKEDEDFDDQDLEGWNEVNFSSNSREVPKTNQSSYEKKQQINPAPVQTASKPLALKKANIEKATKAKSQEILEQSGNGSGWDVDFEFDKL
jgi:outer membrane biosynthesis protein TonB